MAFQVLGVNHVNVTVPAAFETEARHFYGVVLGLRQIPKPEGTRKNIGAWYQLGRIQLHLSIEDGVDNQASERHVCYQVADIAGAELHFRASAIEVIVDPNPAGGGSRFFIRDPGANLIEITEATNSV